MKIESYFSGYKGGYIILILNELSGERYLMGSIGDFEAARLDAINKMQRLRWCDCIVAYYQENVAFVEEFSELESFRFEQESPEAVKNAMIKALRHSSDIRIMDNPLV